MKRKALAVAVGALFVAPAAQAQITFGNDQIGTMQIYGKLYPQYGWFSSHGATQPGSAVATFQGTGTGTAASPLGVIAAAAPERRRRQLVHRLSRRARLGPWLWRPEGDLAARAVDPIRRRHGYLRLAQLLR